MYPLFEEDGSTHKKGIQGQNVNKNQGIDYGDDWTRRFWNVLDLNIQCDLN